MPFASKAFITVVGKTYKPNKGKVLELNKAMEDYMKAVSYFLSFNTTSIVQLQRLAYKKAREKFGLGSALTATARDKAIETLKSFRKHKHNGKCPIVKNVSLRFDQRNFKLKKQSTSITQYWLVLSLRKEVRIALPVVFGERQGQMIEEALQGKWSIQVVEMVKRDGEWYAHFVLEREIETKENYETVIGVDLGERNIATAVAISKDNPSKPMKGQFWSGSKIRGIRGKYNHVRRSLSKKKRIDLVERIGTEEGRKVNHELHKIAKQVVEYAKQFKDPVIVMENLKNIMERINYGKKQNKKLHAWAFRELQNYIEYKAKLEGIQVIYISPKNTTRSCHRCGYVQKTVNGREFRCPKCGLKYNRDLNASINLALTLMRGEGWGSCGSPELPDEAYGVKPRGIGEALPFKVEQPTLSTISLSFRIFQEVSKIPFLQ